MHRAWIFHHAIDITYGELAWTTCEIIYDLSDNSALYDDIISEM